jgi:murein DD-endopeptidase MepM/ murein hydrolase activator NlpD
VTRIEPITLMDRLRVRARRGTGVALVCVAIASAAALADDEPRAHVEPVVARDARPRAPRDAIMDQLAGEAETVQHAAAIVADKLNAADATGLAHLRAAVRVLHAPLATDASDADRMTAARRHAVARLITRRDTAERTLLADELDHLAGAAKRVTDDTTRAPQIELPESIGWPIARGPVTVARKFGAFAHERSHAQLSRRGVDLDVADRAPVVASADGTVRYAGPIRGLDDGVIVDHGTFYTVVGKLAAPNLPVGATVHRGDRIGRAARHRVYFEVRVKLGSGGIPIDPEAVLAPAKPR